MCYECPAICLCFSDDLRGGCDILHRWLGNGRSGSRVALYSGRIVRRLLRPSRRGIPVSRQTPVFAVNGPGNEKVYRYSSVSRQTPVFAINGPGNGKVFRYSSVSRQTPVIAVNGPGNGKVFRYINPGQ